jgi:hypothetical protein
MVEELTLERVNQLLDQAVAERGADYVYVRPQASADRRCLYSHGDSPGCIVGYVLHKLGVPLITLAQYEGMPAREILPVLGLVPFDPDLRTAEQTEIVFLLNRVQHAQDRHQTWGYAVTEMRRWEPTI